MCDNFDLDNNYLKDSCLPVFFNNHYLYLNKNNHLILESNFDYMFKILPDFKIICKNLKSFSDLENANSFFELVEKFRIDYDLQQTKFSKITDNQIQILDFNPINIIKNTEGNLERVELLIKVLKIKENTKTVRQIALDTLYNFAKLDSNALALFDILIDNTTYLQTEVIKEIQKENYIANSIKLSLIYT